MVSSSVNANATDTTLSNIPPATKKVRIQKFGGMLPATGDGKDGVVLLQWGNATDGWTTIRAGSGCFEFVIDREFVGNGTNRFRVSRTNASAVAKPIYAWVDAFVL